MRKTKKWLSILLAAFMTAGTICIPVPAVETDTIQLDAEDTDYIESDRTDSMEELNLTPGPASEDEENDEDNKAATYTVTLDANGGVFRDEWDDSLNEAPVTAESVVKVVSEGEAITAVPVWEQEDSAATFLGWSLEQDGELITTENEENGEYAPVADGTLYAVWATEEPAGETPEMQIPTEENPDDLIPNPDEETDLLQDTGSEEANQEEANQEENSDADALVETEEDVFVQEDPEEVIVTEDPALYVVEDEESLVEAEDPADSAAAVVESAAENENADTGKTETAAQNEQNEQNVKEDAKKAATAEKETPILIEEAGETETLKTEAANSVSTANLTSISVTDCGAKGTDTEDDQAAIQKALDMAKTNGTASSPFTVIVPAGNYYLSKRLRIYSNTKLVLNSNAVINRMYDDQLMLINGDISGSTGGYGAIKNVVISGGTWKGNVTAVKTGYGANAVNLFYFWHGTNITIRNTTLSGCCGDHFIELCAVKDSTVENVTLKDFYRMNGADYSQIDGSASAKPDTDGDAPSGLSEAIQLDYAQKRVSASAAPYDNTPCTNIKITKCTFNGMACGVGNHHAAPSKQSEKITISNNTFNNIGGYCVNLPGMTDVTVSGNTAANVQSFAVLHHGADAVLSGNTVTYDKSKKNKLHLVFVLNSSAVLKNNTLKGSGKCIVAGSGSTVRMTSNTITPISGDGSTDNTVYLYGCKVFTATANTITGSRAAAIAVGKGSKGSITKNTISKPAQKGVFVSGGTATITKNSITNAPQSAITVSGGSATITGNTASKVHSFLVISNKAKVTAKSNTATYDNVAKSPAYLVNCHNATVTLEKNTLKGSGKSIISATGGTVTFRDNTLTPVKGDGSKDNTVYLSSCTYTMTGNTISGSRKAAISIAKKATGNLYGNIIKNAAGNGINVNASTINLKGKDSITGSGKIGIYIGNKSTATIKNAIIKDSKKTGVFTEGQSSLTISGTKVVNSKEEGIFVNGKSTVKAVNNTISKSGSNGINVKGGKATISKNKISGSKNKDIRVVEGDDGSKVTGTVSENTITKKGMKLAATIKSSKNVKK